MFAKVRRTISTALYGEVIPQEMSMDERRVVWPGAQALDTRHVHNCKMVPNRLHLLDLMPKDGVCAEVGIFTCDFSTEILNRTAPRQLHLLDIDPQWIEVAKARFPTEIDCGRIATHLGDSSTLLRAMPPAFFDWVYIDGDHSYTGCKADLEAAADRLKPGGVLVFNDYTFFGASDFNKYGVMEAVNEFCVARDFEFICFALQGRGYHDVAIRQIV